MARGKKKPAVSAEPYKTPDFSEANDLPLADMLKDDYSGPTAMAAMDLNTPEGKMLFVNIGGVATAKPDSLRGQVFQLSAWCAERRLFTDEADGTERWGISINLISNDGMIVRFGSEAVARALDRIRKAFGNGPYEPSLPLRIEQVDTSNGRRTYSVVLLPFGEYDPPKPKGTRRKRVS